MSGTLPRAAVAALCAALAACGQLPRPFQPEASAPPNQLLVLPDRVGVIVGRVPDLDPTAATALAEALAEALRRTDVLASTRGGNAASYDVDGYINQDGDSRRLVFDLLQPNGAVAGRHTVSIPGGADEVARDPERDWAPIANAVAPYLAAALLGEPPPQIATAAPPPPASEAPAVEPPPAPGTAGSAERSLLPAPPTPRPPPLVAAAASAKPAVALMPVAAKPDEPVIAILPVTGGSDSNGRILASALDFHLQQYRIKTVAKAGATTHQVRGTLKITDKSGSQRNLAVVWIVLAPDGKELGKIEQANDVPAPMLQNSWPDIAFAVAGGAAEGIINVLEERGILH